jgi:hypothetical protein
MKHFLLLIMSACELVGVSIEIQHLSDVKQLAAIGLLAIYIPLSHHILERAVD